MKKLLAIAALSAFPVAALAAPGWMNTNHLVGDMYTYGSADTMSVFLEGSTCQNTKDYYYLDPNQVTATFSVFGSRGNDSAKVNK